MKLHRLLLTATSAAVTYWLVSNRKEIMHHSQETTALTKKAKKELDQIKEQVTLLQDYQAPIKELTQDLQYRIQVYKQSISGNVALLQSLKEKYTQDEKNDA